MIYTKLDPSKDIVSPATSSIYYYKGNEVSATSLPSTNYESHWLVIEYNGKTNNYVFDTEVELENFAKTTSYANVLADKFAKVKATRAYSAKNHSIEKFEQTGVVPEDYTAYLQSLTRAGRVNGVGILHDNLNASGSIFPISGAPQPILPGFDNKAESASGFGLVNSVWDRTFFRGSSRYLLLGTGAVLNFDGLNFQN